jgi:hypothetical protein
MTVDNRPFTSFWLDSNFIALHFLFYFSYFSYDGQNISRSMQEQRKWQNNYI